MQYFAYIHGLGGPDTNRKEKNVVKKWENRQRYVLFIDAGWNQTSETYKDKEARVFEEIAVWLMQDKSKPVCIVGTSAGGPLAINVFYMLRQAGYNVAGVSGCGKLTGIQAIGPRYSRPHPALVPAVQRCEAVVQQLSREDKERLLTVGPLFDEVVSTKFMKIPGVRHKTTFTLGHAPSIYWLIKHRKNLMFKFATRVLT